ncbi:MAG: aldo/keto reductase [Clostridia bacterium]|nr:aldo/keto reductase [Clostridia bacterium]
MRMPLSSDQNNDINYAAGKALIDIAYRSGVNYFDTAYMYHGGESERFIGEALSAYPRDSFYLADKMPGWLIGDGGAEKAKEIFADQLSKCRVEYFDFYLLHSLSSKEDYQRVYCDAGVLAYLDSEKENGRIRNLGFSFHGSVEFFEFMMRQRKWDFCQIQLNYMDWDNQNARELYRLSEEYGVPLIIMEPVRGGSLVKLCDEAVSILRAAEPERSIASWAIRFAASLPNVLCVLSGMSDELQVSDNCATLTDFIPLTEEDHVTLSRAVAAYNRAGTIPCTACRYCFECPAQIMIPELFAAYNAAASEDRLPMSVGIDDTEVARRKRAFLDAYDTIPDDKQAHNCIKCGKCVEHCPQAIKIPDRLKEIARLAQRSR